MAAIIFDLDGTLVDSAPVIRDVANALLSELKLPPLDLATTKSYVGHGVAHFLSRALAHYKRNINERTHAAMVVRFEEIYAASPAAANTPYASVDQTLRELHRRGHRLGLCTNKPGIPARAVLKAHGWTDLFDVVVAGDTLPQKKPDPTPLLHAAGALGAAPVVYIGDSEVDAATATAARMPFALFTEGYAKTRIEEIEHTLAFADWSRLPELLSTIISAG
jgi:phosphoglycolate phosphatase